VEVVKNAVILSNSFGLSLYVGLFIIVAYSTQLTAHVPGWAAVGNDKQ